MMLPLNATMMLNDRLNLDNKETWEDSWFKISKIRRYINDGRNCYSFIKYIYRFPHNFPEEHKKMVIKMNHEI